MELYMCCQFYDSVCTYTYIFATKNDANWKVDISYTGVMKKIILFLFKKFKILIWWKWKIVIDTYVCTYVCMYVPK
jgi:hypothetical protein